MAKKKRKQESDGLERDDLSSLLAPTPRPVRLAPVRIPETINWPSISDRRLYYPNVTERRGYAPPLSFKGTKVNVVREIKSNVRQPRIISKYNPVTGRNEKRMSSGISSSLGSTRMVFDVPKSVVMCARRKVRKEVLFAKGRTGKGVRTRKRRNEWSNVKC